MGHDAMYWLKWTVGNDVRERASGMGRGRWNVVWVCVVLHLSISYFPSCTQIWCWVNNSFDHHSTPCCVCANVDGVPLQKSVKIANGFSLYFAILMGIRVHSSCFAYSEAPDCSLSDAQELQSSWKCP